MERTARPLFPAVIAQVAEHPRAFSFAQIVRLLRLWARPGSAAAWEEIARERLRFRPPLSLAFTPADVHGISLEPVEPGEGTARAGTGAPPEPARQSEAPIPFARATITASFLGLYGPSSPLPTFYTERLLDEAEEDFSTVREFMDIFNNNFFLLHAGITSISDPVRRALEEQDPGARHMLAAMGGFYAPGTVAGAGDMELAMLRYVGLFSQFPRSALGLSAVVADAVGAGATRVIQNVERRVRIPDDQRLCLGASACALGENAVIGSEIPCRSGKITVEIRDLAAKDLQRLMPDSPLGRSLHHLITKYCGRPMEYEARLKTAPGQAPPLRLGAGEPGHTSPAGPDAPEPLRLAPRLGLNAWLGAGLDENGKEAPGLAHAEAFFPAGFGA